MSKASELDYSNVVPNFSFAGVMQGAKLVSINPHADWLIKNRVAPVGFETNYSEIKKEGDIETKQVYIDFWFKISKDNICKSEKGVFLYINNKGSVKDAEGNFLTEHSPFDSTDPAGLKCPKYNAIGRLIRHRVFLKPNNTQNAKETGMPMYMDIYGSVKREGVWLTESDLYDATDPSKGKAVKVCEGMIDFVTTIRSILGLRKEDKYDLFSGEKREKVLNGKQDWSAFIAKVQSTELVLRLAFKTEKGYQEVRKISTFWSEKSEDYLIEQAQKYPEGARGRIWGSYGKNVIARPIEYSSGPSEEKANEYEDKWSKITGSSSENSDYKEPHLPSSSEQDEEDFPF